MQYEPIKKSLGTLFTRSVILRRFFFLLLDLLLLRTWHVKKALIKVASALPENSRVLDAGCGFGQYTWGMSSLGKSWVIKAVDINKDQIEDCSNFIKKTGRQTRVMFETGDLTKLNEKSIYDLVLTVDVMEHIEQDELVFTNFCNSLKENGILMISTPSDQGGSDVHDHDDHSFIDEHVRDGYSKADMERKLRSAGFRAIEILYTYGTAGTISWNLSMKYPIKMINRSYLFFILLPLYYLVFFPFCVILNFIDLYSSNEKGTGLLVIAHK